MGLDFGKAGSNRLRVKKRVLSHSSRKGARVAHEVVWGKLLAKNAEAQVVIVAAPNLKRAVEAWFAYLEVERQLSANTSEAYARDIAQFLSFLANHLNRLPTLAQLNALAARDVRAFLASRRAQGVGSRSCHARCRRCACSSGSSSAAASARTTRCGRWRCPTCRIRCRSRSPRSKRRALVESADIAAPDAPEWIIARDTAVLALLYGSGLRISEALSLARKDAPIRGRDMLRVTGKGDKTRVVPVLPIVREAVERYIALCPVELGSDDALFVGVRGGPLSPASSSSSSPGPAARLGCQRRRRRMPFAIPSPPICWGRARTCARSRNSWVMRACRPRRATPRSTASTS